MLLESHKNILYVYQILIYIFFFVISGDKEINKCMMVQSLHERGVKREPLVCLLIPKQAGIITDMRTKEDSSSLLFT